MNASVRSLIESVRVTSYPLCIEKLRIVLQSLEATTDRPMIERRAPVFADVLDRMPILIEDGELIVGNGASKPMGLEIDPACGIWTQDEVDSLKADGYVISPEDERELQRLNACGGPSGPSSRPSSRPARIAGRARSGQRCSARTSGGCRAEVSPAAPDRENVSLDGAS